MSSTEETAVDRTARVEHSNKHNCRGKIVGSLKNAILYHCMA